MGFLNIAIILSFFEVFYAIFRDFLGFWDLVRFWDFSKDFFLFLMKCTKIFRVIYPSSYYTVLRAFSFKLWFKRIKILIILPLYRVSPLYYKQV
jgi:hypothetical protein